MRSGPATGAVRNTLQPTGLNLRFVENEGSLVPRLLVSVRSVIEAERAIRGGAQILDVKEPARGSLGMAPMSDISAIAELAEFANGTVPLSVALGELDDWSSTVPIPQLPPGVRFAKMGLSQTALDEEWITRWVRVRRLFDQQSHQRLSWVGVAYADAHNANSPSIDQVLVAAIKTGCEGLLIDTWKKDGRQLTCHTDVDRLEEVADRCHRAGLFLALAGCLDVGSVSDLLNVPSDVIAIRSAACRACDRTSELDSTQVAAFREKLHLTFSQSSAKQNG